MSRPGGSEGIQQLLAAEQAAQAIVQAARQEKATKIKQAQSEAQREVQAYKAQKEDAYKKAMELGKGDAGRRLRELSEQTATEVEALEQSVGTKQPKVVRSIVQWVTSVM